MWSTCYQTLGVGGFTYILVNPTKQLAPWNYMVSFDPIVALRSGVSQHHEQKRRKPKAKLNMYVCNVHASAKSRNAWNHDVVNPTWLNRLSFF